MPSFNNLSQIESYLLKVLAECMTEVGNKANELLRTHVQQDVYDVGTEYGRSNYYNGTGEPTGELKESVTTGMPKINGNSVSVDVYHDVNKMRVEPEHYLHGSNYWTTDDVRDILPYLIDQGKTGGLFGAVWDHLKRPYFTNTVDEIEGKRLVKVWMTESLKKRGIDVAG